MAMIVSGKYGDHPGCMGIHCGKLTKEIDDAYCSNECKKHTEKLIHFVKKHEPTVTEWDDTQGMVCRWGEINMKIILKRNGRLWRNGSSGKTEEVLDVYYGIGLKKHLQRGLCFSAFKDLFMRRLALGGEIELEVKILKDNNARLSH